MDELLQFEHSIAAALEGLGCDAYSVVDLRRDTRECRDEIYAETVQNGGDVASPFVNFIISDNVAIFTFFEADFSVYVVRCVELELISQTNPLAMSDVEDHRKLLADVYCKNSPDAVISRAHAEHWLG